MKKLKLPILLMLIIVTALSLFAVACNGSSDDPGAYVPVIGEFTNPYKEEEIDESTITSYNVVFNYNYEGAQKATVIKADKGATLSQSAAPTPERGGEYTFLGWYTDLQCSTEYDFSNAVNKNIVLFAGWRSQYTAVNFNYNYIGGPEVEKVLVETGASVEKPADPVRNNYEFIGWYTSAVPTENDKPYDFSAKVEKTVTLYAKWTLINVNVVYDMDAEGVSEISPSVVGVGSLVQKPADPVREGYDFAGWVIGENATPFDFNTPITENLAVGDTVTLTASWTVKTYTVTFNWNGYSGTPASVKVEYGKTVSEPESNRSGYVCIWQLNGVNYSFSTAITGDITLTAKWEAESSDNYNVTFMYNYDGAPNGGVYKALSVRKNRKIEMSDLGTVAREGYYLEGWYKDAQYAEAFDFDQRITSSQTVYAKWLKKFTFEAEYTNLDDFVGVGYSVNTSGTNAIKKDNGTAQASGGYYVSDMYARGCTLSFTINSTGETDEAIIILRVNAEYVDHMYFTSDTYLVEVNGVKVEYARYDIEGYGTIQNDDRQPFQDWDLKVKVHLNDGENVIKLTTENTVDIDAVHGMHAGTMAAYAPMLDCIYVCTDTELSWNPRTDNIK